MFAALVCQRHSINLLNPLRTTFLTYPKPHRWPRTHTLPPFNTRNYTNPRRDVHRARKRNTTIPYEIVQLVNSANNLEPPIPLSQLLSSLNLETHFVELVSESPTPIVKIFAKRDIADQARARKRERVESPTGGGETKFIQMTWGVEEGDLKRKLGQARKELEKGNHINLVFGKKKHVRLLAPGVREQMIREVMEVMDDIAKERKPRGMTEIATILYLSKKAS
jgi:translation initiation factor IF-3